MYGKLGLFILLVCLAGNAKSSRNKSCVAGNSYPYSGVKTSYSVVYNGTANQIELPNCKPLQIWLLCRHGTRYPKTSRIEQMLNMEHFRDTIVNNHKIDHRGHLCAKKVKALKNWRPYYDLDSTKGKRLTSQGKKELSSLGCRLRTKFPELFKKDAPENYEIRSTDTSRTISSMRSFIKGAFTKKFPIEMTVVPIIYDTLLKAYENCESWKEERFDEQVVMFLNGPEIEKVVIDVSRRLGFVNETLSIDDMLLINDLCRFERAWHPNKESPWCAAFTDEDMHVLEYEEDLYHYYSVGPGKETNSKLGCFPVQDMVERFTNLENAKNNSEPRGVFYFTHSETIMLFFSAMGIGKEPVPLTASNYRQMDQRSWRTSLLVPFAANFAAVFYSCDSSESPFKVAFYVAEKPLTLEGCSNGVCDWAQLKEKLSSIVTNCSLEFCQRTPEGSH